MAEGKEGTATYGPSRENQAARANPTHGELDGNQGIRTASLYCSLLAAALSLHDRSVQPIPSEALGEVVQAGGQVMKGGPMSAGGCSAVGTLSDQIAYDVALIRYAQCFGLDFPPSDFDPPTQGRRDVEQELAERGVILPWAESQIVAPVD
jgi:hypothetical protein